MKPWRERATPWIDRERNLGGRERTLAGRERETECVNGVKAMVYFMCVSYAIVGRKKGEKCFLDFFFYRTGSHQELHTTL